MKPKNLTNMLYSNFIFRIALATALILMIPLVAMQISSNVNWSLVDFALIGTLLFGTGLIYQFIASKMQNRDQRIMVGIFCALAVVYIWAELAVGIFTNWGS